MLPGHTPVRTGCGAGDLVLDLLRGLVEAPAALHATPVVSFAAAPIPAVPIASVAAAAGVPTAASAVTAAAGVPTAASAGVSAVVPVVLHGIGRLLLGAICMCSYGVNHIIRSSTRT
jgi:hypothetical protein